MDKSSKYITVALAGSPNVGKSTIFNLLTGLSQHVGNWPGKTVEQKTGICRHGDITLNIIDLPGTYSLTANSLEEQIARDYLIKEKPDVVVAVINAASLERGLYLVAELIELAPRIIIALNMIDVARQQGIKIDIEALSSALDIPVIPVIATRNRGLMELVNQIIAEYERPFEKRLLKHVEYGSSVEKIIDMVAELLTPDIIDPYPRHWAAMKLLEGDEQIKNIVQKSITAEKKPRLETILRANESAALTIATLRFEWVTKLSAVAQEKPPLSRVSLTEKIDRVATHPIWGLIFLATVLAGIFGLVYSIGIPLQNLLEDMLIHRSQEWILSSLFGVPDWLRHLLADGLLGGAGIVLTFIPLLFIFFFVWAMIEDSGYTARAAFVTDRYMHAIGLHGKSMLPLCLGFGCNVPAVFGTRIIDSPRARLLTILLAPLIPCAGRMSVVAIIAAAFFGNHAFLVYWGLLISNLLILLAIGFVLNRFIMHGEEEVLIMELPLYHIPDLRLAGIITWHNLVAFIKRAGTVILLVSLFVWLLSVIPEGNIENSLLAACGRLLEPLGRLIGLNWQMMIALISSFVAKENTIATLGVMLGEGGNGFTNSLSTILTPSGALAFLVLQMLFIPCIATTGAIRSETGTWRWPLFSIALQLIVSFAAAIVVYRVALLIMS